MDVEKLVAEEAAWLAQQEAGVLHEMLGLYKETSAELEQKLKGMERSTYTRRHVQAIGAQLDVLIQEMGDRQAAVLGKSVQLTFKEQLFRERDAWQGLEAAFGNPAVAEQFAAIKPIVPQRAVKALLKATDVSIKNFTDDMSRDVRRAAAKSLLAGEGMNQTIKRVRRVTGSGVAPARVQLISRMETARASNAAKQEYIDQVNKELPELELWQMIKGRVDRSKDTRNHWMTWAINGTVRNVTKGEYFEVHLAAIALIKAQYTLITRRKATDAGILWEDFELGLRSVKLPAHFGDRDGIVGYRPSWGEMAGPVKHPQGPIPSGFEEDEPDEPGPAEGVRSASPAQSGAAGEYAAPLPPNGKFSRMTGPEARAAMVHDGQEALSVNDAFWARQLAREPEIARLQKKGGKRTLKEGDKLKRLLREEKLEITQYETVLQDMGQELRAAIAEPGPSRLQLVFLESASDEFRQKAETIATTFSQMLGHRAIKLPPVKIKELKGPPQFIPPDTIHLPPKYNPKFAAHELAHFLEQWDRHALQASLKFLDNRVKGEDFVLLSELSPLGLFGKEEYTRKDAFSDPYSGKAYYMPRKSLKEKERSLPLFDGEPPMKSEILSTGFEQMYRNPALFAAQDPDFFDFIWGVMHGEDRAGG